MNMGEVYTKKEMRRQKIAISSRTANMDGKKYSLARHKQEAQRHRWLNKRNGVTTGKQKRLKPVRVRKTLTYGRLEPYEGKLSRTVLRRERQGNLPDPANQMKEDESMAFRIWNYTYLEALKTKRTQGAVTRIKLVPAIVIYLEPTKNTPDELILEIEDMNKSILRVKYPTLKLLDYSMAELEERNLILLLPFYLLKLRKRVKAVRSQKGLEKLSLEMVELIKELARITDLSVKKGSLSREDMAKMIGLIQLLYKRLYNDTELQEAEKVMEELLVTKVDIALDKAKRVEDKLKSALKSAEDKAKSAEDKLKTAKKVNARKIALNMLRKGFSCDQVAEMTELSLREVKALTKQSQKQ